MARVFTEKKSRGGMKLFFFIALILLIVFSIWYFTESLYASHEREQMSVAQDAIIRATVQCYSLEGRYPPGIDYLQENYGIVLDQEKYVYYYQSIGTNIMPNIRVMKL